VARKKPIEPWMKARSSSLKAVRLCPMAAAA
jgi:hypothetical protein